MPKTRVRGKKSGASPTDTGRWHTLTGAPPGSSVDACRLRLEPELEVVFGSLLGRDTESVLLSLRSLTPDRFRCAADGSLLSPTLDGFRCEADGSDAVRLALLPLRPGWSLCASYEAGWYRVQEDDDSDPDSDRPAPPPLSYRCACSPSPAPSPADPLLYPREGPAPAPSPVGGELLVEVLATLSLKSSTARRRHSSGPEEDIPPAPAPRRFEQ